MSEIPARLSKALEGRYSIEGVAGEGGMATVYLARDLKHERRVAIKVLRPELAATLGSDRFLREIRIAANLQHPHVLPLHDSGDADGFLFYVMPFVDGESLRDRIRRDGELPIADAARILRDVADALAYAHQQGVVHRDIKPDNVMLSGRHALVTDFGVYGGIERLADLAWIRLIVGDYDGAFADLERVREGPHPKLVSNGALRMHPIYDPIRNDPRFERLLQGWPR